MADLAQRAVFVSSSTTRDVDDNDGGSGNTAASRVRGPCSDFDDAHALLESYAHIGFQATNYGRAVAIARAMLRPQPASRVYVVQDGAFVEVPPTHDDDDEHDDALVYPHLFLGVTANLFGTGCREAIRFLVRHGVQRRRRRRESAAVPGDHDGDAPLPYVSFVSAIVVSGGAIEHDIRRACMPYTLTCYASEAATTSSSSTTTCSHRRDDNDACAYARFGNVLYDAGHVVRQHSSNSNDDAATTTLTLFDHVMCALVARLRQHQDALAAATAAAVSTQPSSNVYDVCPWVLTPSKVWQLAGLWLVELLEHALDAVAAVRGHGVDDSSSTEDAARMRHDEARRRAESTVVYWAARQGVPLFCPSLVDGDIMAYIVRDAEAASTAGATPPQTQPRRGLQLDLVGDIHALNKMAMQSKKSGMIVCGGGVVKHHVCNANLMRNGADYAIFVNNGAEYDGSDAGARPDEAVSWGKIRIDGQSVKVYSEATAVLQLLVGHAFVPAARAARDQDGSGSSSSTQ